MSVQSGGSGGCGIVLFLFLAGVLALVLAPTHPTRLDDESVEATRIQLAKVARALDAYVTDPSTPLPATLADLTPAALPDPPVDAWGDALLFIPACTDGRWSYRVLSLGRDGKPGGDASNADIEYAGPYPVDLVVACPR